NQARAVVVLDLEHRRRGRLARVADNAARRDPDLRDQFHHFSHARRLLQLRGSSAAVAVLGIVAFTAARAASRTATDGSDRSRSMLASSSGSCSFPAASIATTR